MVSHPFVQAWSPVFQDVGLGEFHPLSVSETTLCTGRGDNEDILEIYLYPFFQVGGGWGEGTPGATVELVPDSEKTREVFNEVLLKFLMFINEILIISVSLWKV